MLNAFWIATQFLTRFPTPKQIVISDTDLGKSLLFYPAVGVLIGLMLMLIHGVINDIANTNITAVVILVAWVLASGALHLDGLADSADAWAGGFNNREKTLEIMKDPQCGSIAVVVICLTLLLKYILIEQIINSQQLSILLLAPVIGRTSIIALFLCTEYVRNAGLGEKIVNYLPKSPAIKVLVAVLILVFFFPNGFWILASSAIMFYFMRRLMIKRIAGTTGDTAGAMVEMIELSALMAVALVSY